MWETAIRRLGADPSALQISHTGIHEAQLRLQA